jgi:capsular exopolysaccharide synthesis family protein
VIGYIGEISNSNGDSTIYVANEPLSPITEGFRSLKTTIDFSDGNNPPKTILITSANPAEGKTTIAVNLATVYSQGGKDVVIIDADFRRPSIHRYFGLSNRKGLSDVIQGTADARSVIRTRKDINLSVISSGSLPPNPAELLASDKTTRFFEHLKQLKLVSIIDTPPFLVSDAIQLAAKVDGVIIVVKPGKTSIHSLMAAKEQLDRVGANILGVVFNRIPRNRGYYYGSYQHYSKYYSKGYHKYYSGSDGNGSKPAEEMEKKPVKSKGVGSS